MRPILPCPELARELRPYKGLQKFYHSLEPSQQEQINGRILEAVKKETRRRRAAQEAERLMEVMEAEHDLPPLITRGFARNLDARRGWERMPALLRRRYLIHILHSRYPDTRERTLHYALKEFARSVGAGLETSPLMNTDRTDYR